MRHPLSEAETRRAKWIFAHPSGEETDRELELLISIEKQFLKDGMLSDAQINLIEEIFTRHE